MNKLEVRKYIDKICFILWLATLLKVITDNIVNLKATCILLLVYILLITARDIWSNKAGDK